MITTEIKNLTLGAIALSLFTMARAASDRLLHLCGSSLEDLAALTLGQIANAARDRVQAVAQAIRDSWQMAIALLSLLDWAIHGDNPPPANNPSDRLLSLVGDRLHNWQAWISAQAARFSRE